MRFSSLAFALIVCGLVAAPRGAQAQTATEQVMQACVADFAFEGTFWRGRTFRAHGDVAGVTTPVAVQRIAQKLALQSVWRDVRADRDIGTVSATMGAQGNDAAVVPLNIVVQDKEGGGVTVQAVFMARGGLMVQLEPVRNLMCEAVASAAG